MGVYTLEREVTCPMAPTKAFKSFVLDFDTLFPKAAPHAIKSSERLEGNGGPGSIKKITFAEGWGFDYVKQTIDELDEDNLSYAYTTFEGEILKNALEKICYEAKFVAAANGETNIKITTKYYTIGDIEMKEEVMKNAMEKQAQVFKAVQDYVLANPDA